MPASNYQRCACCTKPVAPRHLMCQRHWRQVPSHLQAEVLRTWRAYTNSKLMDRRPSLLQDYSKARAAAVDAVMGEVEAPPKEGTA